MNNKFAAIFALAIGLVAGSLLVAQGQNDVKPSPDPRVQKLLDNDELILRNQDQILKNQAQMMEDLSNLKEGVLQLRRRSS